MGIETDIRTSDRGPERELSLVWESNSERDSGINFNTFRVYRM